MNNNLVLTRFNYGPEDTFGSLEFPTHERFYTCEQPWNNNTPFKSCIPDGVYHLEKRASNKVWESSGNEFREGWEITGVPGRDLCMLHPANWAYELAGCISPGLSYKITRARNGKYLNSVMSSRDAFRQVMGLLDQYNTWTLDIRPFIMEYP